MERSPARLHRQHGEALTDLQRLTPDSGNAEDPLIRLSEQSFLLALLFRILGVWELAEAVGDNQAAVRIEFPILRAKIIDLRLFGPGQLLRRCTSSASLRAPSVDVVIRWP